MRVFEYPRAYVYLPPQQLHLPCLQQRETNALESIRRSYPHHQYCIYILETNKQQVGEVGNEVGGSSGTTREVHMRPVGGAVAAEVVECCADEGGFGGNHE